MRSYRSSQPNSWVLPRPHRDPTLRHLHYGPILPMDPPSHHGHLTRLGKAAALILIIGTCLSLYWLV